MQINKLRDVVIPKRRRVGDHGFQDNLTLVEVWEQPLDSWPEADPFLLGEPCCYTQYHMGYTHASSKELCLSTLQI